MTDIKPIKESEFHIIEAVAGKIKFEDVRYISEGRGFKLFMKINGIPFFLAKNDGSHKVFLTESAALRFAKIFLNIKQVTFDIEHWEKEGVTSEQDAEEMAVESA